MKAPTDKSPEPQRQATAHEAPQQQDRSDTELQFVDNRAETASLRQLQEAADNSPRRQGLAQLKAMMNSSPRRGAMQSLQAMVDNSLRRASMGLQADSDDVTVQRVEDEEVLQGGFAAESPVQLAQSPDAKPNNTGMPDNLKTGVESLSGLSLDNVKVHYNSSEPALLNAHAYAQGTDIHVGPGQEQHLPHEAWHVVQQAQGRVKPTVQMKDGVEVNDDRGLEAEADLMGGKASAHQVSTSIEPDSIETMQRKETPTQQNKTAPTISAPEGAGSGSYRINAGAGGRSLDSVKVHAKGQSTIEVTDLGVDQTQCGQGLGGALIASALKTSQQQGKKTVSLAAQDNGSGHLTQWYKKMGFGQSAQLKAMDDKYNVQQMLHIQNRENKTGFPIPTLSIISAPITQRFIMIDRLNVVGEDHEISNKRRNNERKFTSLKFGHDYAYWMEDEFVPSYDLTKYDLEQVSQGKKARPRTGDKYKYRFDTFVSLLSSQILVFDKLPDEKPLFGYQYTLAPIVKNSKAVAGNAHVLKKLVEDYHKYKIGPTAHGMYHEFKDSAETKDYVLELHRLFEEIHKDLTRVTANLYDESIADIRSKIDQAKIIFAFVNQKCIEGTAEQFNAISERRSIAMHSAALKWKTPGIWKVGDDHRKDIKNKLGMVAKYHRVPESVFDSDLGNYKKPDDQAE